MCFIQKFEETEKLHPAFLGFHSKTATGKPVFNSKPTPFKIAYSAKKTHRTLQDYFHPIAFVQHLKRLFASTFPFEKPNRAVHSVFLHCSASDLPEHDSVDVIEDWHKQRGWDGIGYHYFIKKDGTIQVGRDLEKIPIAQSGHNTGSIAICLHGLKKEKFTNDQYNSVVSVCSAIRGQYMPQKIKFRGHCEVSSKTCPVFDYKKVLDLDVNGYMK